MRYNQHIANEVTDRLVAAGGLRLLATHTHVRQFLSCTTRQGLDPEETLWSVIRRIGDGDDPEALTGAVFGAEHVATVRRLIRLGVLDGDAEFGAAEVNAAVAEFSAELGDPDAVAEFLGEGP